NGAASSKHAKPHLCVYLDYDDRIERHFPHDINPEVLRLLELAGYDRRIYTENPHRNHHVFSAKGAKCKL
ncbi:MAG: hypothetical protein M0R49_09715, partial [Limnochordia bacterium]|nr:hypothetical protein [Limnochordia bacterium]